MPTIQRSALVAYSAQAMFDLVNDVEAYPSFLPGCEDSKILERNEQGMKASLLVAKAGIKQWFTTSNRITPAHAIEMTLVDGPFKRLQGGWRFVPLDEGACKIELLLEFEFSSALVEVAFGKVFQQLTSSMVNAFITRARQVYI